MPGGGAALLHLSELVPAFRQTLEEDEEKLGADIVMKALRSPCSIIAENAGTEGEVSGLLRLLMYGWLSFAVLLSRVPKTWARRARWTRSKVL